MCSSLAGSSRAVCLLFLPILGFPDTYLGRLWFECRGWTIVPKLISASSPPRLSSWLWAGLPYALQDTKVHSQQEHRSREKRALVCSAGVPSTCVSSESEVRTFHKNPSPAYAETLTQRFCTEKAETRHIPMSKWLRYVFLTRCIQCGSLPFKVQNV